MLKEGYTQQEVKEHLENEGYARKKPVPKPMPYTKRRYDVGFKLVKKPDTNGEPF